MEETSAAAPSLSAHQRHGALEPPQRRHGAIEGSGDSCFLTYVNYNGKKLVF